MIFEKRWPEVSAQLLTANGGSNGVLTVPDASAFKVKQRVALRSNTQPAKQLIVNRVTSATTIEVGAVGRDIRSREDCSAYLLVDLANVFAEEQVRVEIGNEDFNRAVYAEEPAVALRTILVDKLGNYYDSSNPLPTSATIDVGSLTVDVALDAFTKNPPDNAIAVGTEDGTKTGTKRALKVGPDGKLEVKDTTAAVSLVSIDSKLNSLGQKNAAGSVPVVMASDQPAIPVSVQGSISINEPVTVDGSVAISGPVTIDEPVTVEGSVSITGPVSLNEPVKVSGTVDGTSSGTELTFVNNRRQQILAAHDRGQDILYADFGTKDQRITQIDYTSATFPGTIARKTISYTLVGTKYRRDTVAWSLI